MMINNNNENIDYYSSIEDIQILIQKFKNGSKQKQRGLCCMLGSYAGDHLGNSNTISTQDMQELKEIMLMNGKGVHQLLPGQSTGSTEMATSLGFGLIESKQVGQMNLDFIAKYFAIWQSSNPFNRPNSINQALKPLQSESIRLESSYMDYYIKSLALKVKASAYENNSELQSSISMKRISPLIVYLSQLSDQEAIKKAVREEQSLTNCNEDVIECSYIFVRACIMLIQGNSAQKTYESICKYVVEECQNKSIQEYWQNHVVGQKYTNAKIQRELVYHAFTQAFIVLHSLAQQELQDLLPKSTMFKLFIKKALVECRESSNNVGIIGALIGAYLELDDFPYSYLQKIINCNLQDRSQILLKYPRQPIYNPRNCIYLCFKLLQYAPNSQQPITIYPPSTDVIQAVHQSQLKKCHQQSIQINKPLKSQNLKNQNLNAIPQREQENIDPTILQIQKQNNDIKSLNNVNKSDYKKTLDSKNMNQQLKEIDSYNVETPKKQKPNNDQLSSTIGKEGITSLKKNSNQQQLSPLNNASTPSSNTFCSSKLQNQQGGVRSSEDKDTLEICGKNINNVFEQLSSNNNKDENKQALKNSNKFFRNSYLTKKAEITSPKINLAKKSNQELEKFDSNDEVEEEKEFVKGKSFNNNFNYPQPVKNIQNEKPLTPNKNNNNDQIASNTIFGETATSQTFSRKKEIDWNDDQMVINSQIQKHNDIKQLYQPKVNFSSGEDKQQSQMIISNKDISKYGPNQRYINYCKDKQKLNLQQQQLLYPNEKKDYNNQMNEQGKKIILADNEYSFGIPNQKYLSQSQMIQKNQEQAKLSNINKPNNTNNNNQQSTPQGLIIHSCQGKNKDQTQLLYSKKELDNKQQSSFGMSQPTLKTRILEKTLKLPSIYLQNKQVYNEKSKLFNQNRQGNLNFTPNQKQQFTKFLLNRKPNATNNEFFKKYFHDTKKNQTDGFGNNKNN